MIRQPLLLIFALFLPSCSWFDSDSKITIEETLRTSPISVAVQSSSDVQAQAKPDLDAPKKVEDTPAKPNMDLVDAKTQMHIERLCNKIKQDGVAPYWNCLSEELKKLDGFSKPDMSVVDIKTKLSMEHKCADTEKDGVIPFWNCLRRELRGIGITPMDKSNSPLIRVQ